MNPVIKQFLSYQATLTNYFRYWQLIVQGIDIHPTCDIAPQVLVSLGFGKGSPGHIQIAEHVTLGQGVVLDSWGGNIILQKSVFLGPYVVIYGHGGVMIKQNTLIAMHCRILSSNHMVPSQDILIRSQPDILLPTKIGQDVWLGAGVTVLGGVTIGDGCVVGAGAVVTKDLPPYSIALGIPAKVVRMRE